MSSADLPPGFIQWKTAIRPSLPPSLPPSFLLVVAAAAVVVVVVAVVAVAVVSSRRRLCRTTATAAAAAVAGGLGVRMVMIGVTAPVAKILDVDSGQRTMHMVQFASKFSPGGVGCSM